MDDITQSIGGSYVANFDAILNGEDIKNRRTIFEQIILLLLRVLYILYTSEEIVRLLAKILNKDASLLESLDGVANQYCAKKLLEQDHNKAFENTKEELLKCVKTMLKRDKNANVK